jgi:hypothetical protein
VTAGPVFGECSCGHPLDGQCENADCGKRDCVCTYYVTVVQCECGADGDDLWRNVFHAMNVTRCGKCGNEWWGWNL